MLASYAEDNTVRIWDVNAGEDKITFTGVDETATGMRWSPVGDLLGCMIKKN
jgi:WD40 repeat protein